MIVYHILYKCRTRMCIFKYSTTWFENKCRDVNSLVFWLHVANQLFFSEYTGTKWYVCHNFLVDMHELYSNCKSPLIEGFLNLFNSSDMTILKRYNLIHVGDTWYVAPAPPPPFGERAPPRTHPIDKHCAVCHVKHNKMKSTVACALLVHTGICLSFCFYSF